MKAETSSTKKWHQLAKASLLVLVLTLAVSLVSYYVAYPTERHREINREYSELVRLGIEAGDDGVSLGFDAGVMTKDEETHLASLDATPESQYSMRATTILGILQTLFYIVVTYYLYAYIRRNGLARKAVGMVTLIMVAVAVISSAVMWLIDDSGASLQMMLVSLPATVLVVGLVSFVMASLCESWYKRRNSFEI